MDKQDLKKDPVRSKIINILGLITGNIFVSVGLVVFALLLVFGISLYSSNKKMENMNASISFGNAINQSIDGDKETAIIYLTEVLEEQNPSSGTAAAYLIDYYYNQDNIYMVDSILNLEINISDDVLMSKVKSINGDICFNRMEYLDAIDCYSEAIDLNPLIKSELDLKIALTKMEMEDYSSAKIIIKEIMENDNLPYNVKNQCEKYLSIINHSM